MNLSNASGAALFEAERIAIHFQSEAVSVWNLFAALSRTQPPIAERLARHRVAIEYPLPDYGSPRWQAVVAKHRLEKLANRYQSLPLSPEVNETIYRAKLLRGDLGQSEITPALLLLGLLRLGFMSGFIRSLGANPEELDRAVCHELVPIPETTAASATPPKAPSAAQPKPRALSRGELRDLMLEVASREGLNHHRSTRLADRAAEELSRALAPDGKA